MRKKNIFFGGMAVLAIVAVVSGWRAHQTRLEIERERLALATRRHNRSTEVRRLHESLVAGERRRVELTRALEDARSATVGGATEGMHERPVAATPPSSAELIRADPALEAMHLNYLRFVGERDFGAFVTLFRLPPETTRALGEIWVWKAERSMDLKTAARAQDDVGKAVVAKLEKQASDEFRRSVADLLGTDGFKAWEDFTRMNLARVGLAALAGIAAIDGAPLSATQVEQLTTVLHMAGVGRENRRSTNATAIDWTAIDAQSAQILGPAQFALFRSINTGYYSTRWNIALDDALWRAQQADAAAQKPPVRPDGG